MSKQKKVVAAYLWSFINTGFTQTFGFILGIVFARNLGPEAFGLIASTSIFIGLTHLIADSGLGQALIKNKNSSQLDFSTAFYFNVISSLILYIILFFCAPSIAYFLKQPLIKDLIRVVGITVIIQSLTINQSVKLIKELNFKLKSKISISASIFSGIISLWMVFNNFGVWSYVCQLVMVPALSTLLMWLLVRWRPSYKFSFESLKRLLAFGSRLLIVGIIDLFQKNIINLVIAKFFSIRELGFLNRAETLQKAPTVTFSKIINRVAFPVLSGMNDNASKKNITFQRTIRFSAIIIFPLMSFLFFFASPIVLVLLGEAWLPAAEYLRLLTVSGFMYSIQSLYQSFIKSEGEASIILKIEIIRFFLMFPIVIFGFMHGILFFIYGLIIRAFISFLIHVYVLGNMTQLKPRMQIELLMFPLTISLMIAFSSMMLTDVFTLGSLSKLLISSSYCLIMYGIMNKIFNAEDYNEIKMVLIKK